MRILYILASNHAGSHLLSERLAAGGGGLPVGELAHLRKFLHRRGPTSSGTDSNFATAPLYAGLTALPERTWHRTLWERAGRPQMALIDNSKRLDWLLRTAREADDVCAVHLLRDPRAFVHRVASMPGSARALRRQRWRECRRQLEPRILWATPAEVLAWRWLRENRDFMHFIERQGLPSITVSYEELVAAPDATVARLCSGLGLPRLLQADAVALPSSPTFKPAWPVANGPLTPDLRWRDELPRADRTALERLSPLAGLLASLGYRLGPEGLLPAGASS